MSTKKYHSLNYDHTEINLLLSKIEKYKVLTEEEYQHLFVTIGLSKIDQALETIKENKESYELLLKKHEYDKNYLTGCIDAINKALEDQQKIDSNIEELIADLEARVENYYDFVVNLEDGLVVLDEEFKKALRAELDEVINLLNEQEIKTTELTETKADTNHKHNTKDIENFEGELYNFEVHLNERYLLDKINSHIQHPCPKHVFSIKQEDIDAWNHKATLDHIKGLKNEITKIKDSYMTTEEILLCINDLKERLSNYVLLEQYLMDLEQRALVDHSHDLQEINGLLRYLDLKVDKEKNKTLIDYRTLSQLKSLLAQQELLRAGKQEHGHGNIADLDSIQKEDIERWNDKLDSAEAKKLIKQEIENSSLSDLINKDFYTKDEIDLFIQCSEEGSIDKAELEKRLGGLSFKPITQEEFNALPEDEKEINGLVYIITNAPSYEQDKSTFVTGEQLADRVNDVLKDLTVITQAKLLEILDERLDGLKFEQISASKYKELVDNDNLAVGVLYVITDAPDIDMNSYLTIEEFEKRISDPMPSANRPEDPKEGQCYFDTTLKQPIWFDGEGWVDAMGNRIV